MNLESAMVGTSVGRYRLDELLSRGGMGEVWRAFDTTLGRPVAVKLLRAGLTDAADKKRFVREARSAAQLSHPNVVAIFDVGDWLGSSYLVMELLEGKTLAEELADNGPLPIADVRDLGAQAAAGLMAAHAAGVVHRDVKPSNLVRTREGTLKVVDFGIARVLNEASTRLTRTGTIVGTAAYIAPEQARGTDADARTDLYALGCVLYQLLAGRTPFVGGPTEVMYAHLYTEPEPVTRLRPDVPADLEALILSLLAKDPANRPADAATVRTALAGTAQAVRAGTQVDAEAAAAAPTMVTPALLMPDPAATSQPPSTPPEASSPPVSSSQAMSPSQGVSPGQGVPPGQAGPTVGQRGTVGPAPSTSAWGSDAASAAASGSGTGSTRQFRIDDPQRPPERGSGSGPRRGRRRLRTALLVLAVALAVAALAWSVQYLRTQEDPAANAPAPKTTPKQTVPSNTPSPETRGTAEDVPANPEYGSPQWLQQLDSTLATLEAEDLIEEDVADDLRDSIDDALQAYAEGDDSGVERELSHLNKDLTKGFQDGDLPLDGPLTTLFNEDFSGDGGGDGDRRGDSGDGNDGGSDEGDGSDGDGSGY
ncbi:protein kinase [Actinopolymorpha sp. B11F2]|uniref:serine/threonine-protein kinase n=1 Tax=Actinopolymorpha sp. B11F2 TaxID=3160862 RepID=UPI0032E36CE5